MKRDQLSIDRRKVRAAIEAAPEKRELPIQTVYTFEDKLKRKNRAGAPLRATELCMRHMRRNDYGADVAEVWDLRNGKLYSVMTRSAAGEFKTVFEAPLKKGE